MRRIDSFPRRHFLAGGLALAALPVASGASARDAGLEASFMAGRTRTLFEVWPGELGKVIQGFAVDPAGKRVAVFGPTRTDLNIVEVETGHVLFLGKVPFLAQNQGPGSSLSFADDGSKLYWASSTGNALGVVAFDMAAFRILNTVAAGAFHLQGMAIRDGGAYFRTPDFAVVRVDLATGQSARVPEGAGAAAIFKVAGGVYCELPVMRNGQPADGLPVNADRPRQLVCLSPERQGQRLTLPAMAGNAFFIELPDGRWAVASEENTNLPGATPKLIIADAAGRKLSETPFGRPALMLTGFAFAGGRLFAGAEDASEPVREFTVAGVAGATTLFESGRLGVLELAGAGDQLFVRGLYKVAVYE